MILGKEPALILGALAAVAIAALQLASGGGFSDGLSIEEAGQILAPLAAVFGIRATVFSQSTVDELAPRDKQIQVVKRRRRR
jgi:hypothetical protein